MALPIDTVLPDLKAALAANNRALLIAPPGAGKTTRVAPALLDEPWCDGETLLLVPRRLAARAAAEYMARERGERPGQTIGYATRLDSKPGKRVTVMTHGVFLARIQSDPDLPGVGAVLFDEVHERSLDNDLALAFAIESQTGLREDLRLLAMSATLDGAAFARLLDNPPMIESEGKSFPLTLDHVGRDAGAHIEPQMASAIRTALGEHEGSLLAFLPGVREIERTADALGSLSNDIILHRLHGLVDPSAQRAALAPPPEGKRKLVLASAIAETSVTVDGVRIVVDSGLARRPRYDRAAGLTRLVTERASQAAITQRAGRAARQAPGVAIRLWEEAANKALPSHDPPEILEADLSRLTLASLLWGEADPARLPFLDPPAPAALAEARQRLDDMGAIDAEGRITPHGRAIAAIPLEPRLAHMLVEAEAHGLKATAAAAAALLTERGLGGKVEDLEQRYRRWTSDRSKRAEAARGLLRRWGRGQVEPDRIGEAVALAFPDRVARRRDASGEQWQSVGGRGFRLDPVSPLANSKWLAIAEVAGAASGARILSAAPIDGPRVEELLADRITEFSDVRYDSGSRSISATRGRKLGTIALASAPDPNPDESAILKGLLDAVQREGLDILPWNERGKALRTRAQFARTGDASLPNLSDSALLEDLDAWLAPLLHGQKRLDRIDPATLTGALETYAGYDAARRIDRLAPARFQSPAGTSHAIDYAAPGGPKVEVRAQALYGLSEHPKVGAVPLVLSITSPAGRPIQTTTDLPAFWQGSWDDVAKDMRGRYPKHDWPDDPASAAADLRTKARRKS
ncbi:ATP-dependent helicase HrpB [Sphingomicrobium clamense]|uniref:ATP-dependent helicase HrpB n=1 Tax=Sphingomicrobium clamense TaxID=2851013 RepID=A0ABS6V7T7_9SPHN|nr:ATP-dependent helicase HrpB [Sphingomicrobium sp. B8]MBW0145630.1 ATP-dependent helicase HrpB [Sphingomicrobium sp. B8]